MTPGIKAALTKRIYFNSIVKNICYIKAVVNVSCDIKLLCVFNICSGIQIIMVHKSCTTNKYKHKYYKNNQYGLVYL